MNRVLDVLERWNALETLMETSATEGDFRRCNTIAKEMAGLRKLRDA